MHWTAKNRGRKSVLTLTLAVALVGGVCVRGLAQSNTPKDAPLLNRNSTEPVANLASPSSSSAKSSTAKSANGLSSLPTAAQGPISAALGKDDSGYWVRPSSGGPGAKGFREENARQALVTEFTKQGVEVRGHNLRWGIETRAYGYGNTLHPVKAVAPQANANRIEYRRDGVNDDGLTEWYENGPLGLEQGFTLARRPEKVPGKEPGKENDQPLTLELGLRGDLVAALEQGGKALELKGKGKGKDGKAALRYTGLEARDSTGRELRSWLEVKGERLLVRVEDKGARYPVVVDPWIQQAELTASDGAAGDYFGSSVAMSGSMLVVGAPGHAGGGAAYVFVQSGTTWSQQAELTSSNGVGFGSSVAISGGTIVVGAPSNFEVSAGSAYVFVQSGTMWSQQAELTSSDGATGDQFGNSVGVNANTDTIMVGAPGHEVGSNQSQGAAYVFVQNGTTWSQQGELVASNGVEDADFGCSVAVSGDTVMVGAYGQTIGGYSAYGAVYVFVQSGDTWVQQAVLAPSNGESGYLFGWSLAVDGSTAVVGAPDLGNGPGFAYVFAESGGTWSQQAELTPSVSNFGPYFGTSVAVSGSTAVVGAYGHAGSRGAAFVFVQNANGTWSQQAELTVPNGGGALGFSVAVEGNTAVAGAANPVGHLNSPGQAYVFASVPATVTGSVSPASLSFGNEAVDSTSAAKSVTLTNTGNSTMDISGIAVTIGTNFTISKNTCGSTLAAGSKCTASVTFTPTQLGALTGTLTFTDNASNNPQSVPLSGTGIAQATLMPASYDFGKIKVGNTSVRKFTLVNNLPTTLTGISYSTAAPFAVSASTCGTTLNSKDSCTISVTFSPTETGTATGTLTVNDSANNSPQTVSLSGTGVSN
jgi:hypothetical protein